MGPRPRSGTHVVGRSRPGVGPSASDSRDRKVVIEKWVRVLGEAMEASGAEAMDEATISDVVAAKATGTLRKRADALIAFGKWASREHVRPFPLNEVVAYQYLKHLETSCAPPTKASSFRQAVAFAGGLFDLAGAAEVVSSRRGAGAAYAAYTRKRITKQAAPFSAPTVAAMERVVCDPTLGSGFDLEDRVFLGFMLFVIHARARFADAARVTAEPTLDLDADDVGFIEAGATDLKTGRGRSRVRRALPMVGHARGLTGLHWAREWLGIRRHVQLDAKVNETLMPVKLIGGGFGNDRLRTSEGCLWLRELLPRLGTGVGVEDVNRFGSHSGKATLLSWMAKAGASQQDRRLLGAHARPGDLSVLEYSRDALAGPLMQLEKVLRLVREGAFDPDETRSGRWRKVSDLQAVPWRSSSARSSAGLQVGIDTCVVCGEGVDLFMERLTCTYCKSDCHALAPCCVECEACGLPVCRLCESRGLHACQVGVVTPPCEVDSDDDEGHAVEVCSSETDRSSSSSSEPADLSLEGLEVAEAVSDLADSEAPCLWMSRSSGVVHSPADGGVSATACGLPMSAHDVVVLTGWPLGSSRRCRHRGCAIRFGDM